MSTYGNSEERIDRLEARIANLEKVVVGLAKKPKCEDCGKTIGEGCGLAMDGKLTPLCPDCTNARMFSAMGVPEERLNQ